MRRMDRTGGKARRFPTARRRACAAPLLAFALMAGACGDGEQETHVATSGPTGGTSTEPGETEQVLSIVDVGSGTVETLTAPGDAREFDLTLDGSMAAYSGLDGSGNARCS